MLKAKYFILLICFSFLLKTEAKVTLTSILGDNMVLQQQSEVTFSGTATSGKRVQATASWNNKKIQTNVDAKGEWKIPKCHFITYRLHHGNRKAMINWIGLGSVNASWS